MKVAEILRTARLISWSYRILAAAVGIITIRLITDRLGIEGYGEIAFMLALLYGIAAIDFGLLQALPRFVAQLSADTFAERRPVFWSVTLLAGVVVWAVQLLAVLIVAAFLEKLDEVRSIAPWEFIMLGALMVTANALAISSSVAAGFQRYGLAGAGKVGRSLIYLVLMLALWATGTMSVHTVLYGNAVALLAANLPVAVVLYRKFRAQMRTSWVGFPGAHREQLVDITAYSLNGWLFTASTVIISSGTIFMAGMLFSASEVGVLQIALVLYTAVAALVTGSMVPLSTIAARHQDGSPDALVAISTTALLLIEEALVFAAGLIVFFLNFGDLALRFLLGAHASDPLLMAQATQVLYAVVLPSFVMLPLFTFRFVLVKTDENRRFSRRILMGSTTLLLAGALAAWIVGHLLPLAVGAGLALAWRGLLGFFMGRHALPQIRIWRIAAFMTCALLAFELASLAAGLVNVKVLGYDAAYLQAALFLLAAFVMYTQRSRADALLGIRKT